MYRTAIESLQKWKAKTAKRPLIIRGARQVGKTWLMKEFGRLAYPRTVYIGLDKDEKMRDLFAGAHDLKALLLGIRLYSKSAVEPESTLIILDEAQECPRALTWLKYFCEDAPEHHVVGAGSLLGLALRQGTDFPVGKVDFLDLYPLSFYEFLDATGMADFVPLLESGDYALVAPFKKALTDSLKQYFVVGGMPEAVAEFAAGQDFEKVRQIQEGILRAYDQDFSKHAPPSMVGRIRSVWASLPQQLARDNKKFVYKLVGEGARAKEYEHALMWMSDCGLVHKVHRVSTPNLPLKPYADLRAFKLFLVDVGLLSCMAGAAPQMLLEGNAVFKEFKGALTEQYVCQQLKPVSRYGLFYWANDSGHAEVDFLVSTGTANIPVEVKAEVNLQSQSLRAYRAKFAPTVAVRSSMSDYRREDWLLNLPLYAVGSLYKELGRPR